MCANRGSGVRCQGSEVQGLRGSKVQRFKGSRVQRFKGSEVQRFKGLGESDEYRISPRLNNETERFNGVKITNLEPKIIRPKPRKKAAFHSEAAFFICSSSHFLSEDWLSPDGLPAIKPSTLISSSISSQ